MNFRLLLPEPGYRIPMVARMLDVCRATVCRYVESGKLGCFEDYGGQIMVSKAELIRFIEDN